jgi:aspartate ammonia-lyase
MHAPAYRKERDSLGTLEVPVDAYWGINTARALENFPISGRRIHSRIIDSYCRIKKAAAMVNCRVGRLDRKKADAIGQAADEIFSGRFRDQFVVDIFQAGAGTSTNMNVNEVICNRALELLGHGKGAYHILHPNDHVNMGQSTNDTYPTAMHLSVLDALEEFYPAGDLLAASFSRKGKRYRNVIKSARTHLQDAVPVMLGEEFIACARAIRASKRNVRQAAQDLHILAIGGSAAGTGMNTHPRYAEAMVRELAEETRRPLRKAPHLQQAMQSQGPIGRVSSAVKDFAVETGRIASDLRLLSSGPTTGFGEIVLPPVQAGSSIMPGKINPSIPEMVNMVCFHIAGNDMTVSQAVAAGQIDLNVMMPVIAENILESIEILTSACRQLSIRCVDGIEVNRERCRNYAMRSMGLATALAPYIGYLAAADLAKKALAEGKTIPDIVKEKNILSPEELKKVLDPLRMTRPDPDLAQKGEKE